jgi:opacity protein-like surface antigen
MTNKTTKICCTLALLASVATTPALSQTKNFAGPSIALGAATSAGTTKAKDVGDEYVAFDSEYGRINNFIYSADVSYNFPSSGNFFLGIGATYDFNKTDAGSQKLIFGPVVLTDLGVDSASSTVKGKISDHWSLYIQPSYLINNTTAFFGKFGYHEAKLDLSPSVEIDGTTVGLPTASKSTTGYGYGLGLKTLFSDNAYVQIEAEQVDFKAKTIELLPADVGSNPISTKAKTTSGRISIGYKF